MSVCLTLEFENVQERWTAKVLRRESLRSLLTLLDKSASREVLKAHPVFPSSAIMAMPMAVAMAMTTPTRLASPFTAARPVPSFR